VRKSSEAPRSSSDSACRTIFSMSLAALGRSCSSPAASPTTVKHISKSCFARASAYALARLPRAIPFGFPVRPLVGELVFQNSKGKLLRPRNTAQSIDRFCANGVVSGGAHGAIGHRLRRESLRGSPEARPDRHAVGSQHQSGSKPSAIGNSSRRKQQRLWRTLRQIIRDFGDKRQRRAGRSVAASFRALCHDGVGSGIERLVHMPQGLHLADQLGLGVMNLGRAKGCGSPKERNTQYGERFNTSSSACGARSSAQVMKPTPNLRPSTSLSSCARSGSPPSAPAYPPPRIPRPPASETAATKRPPATSAIGADSIGWRIPNCSVNRVFTTAVLSRNPRAALGLKSA